MIDYKIFLTSVIGDLTEVRFYEETREHVKENHPEVPIELPCLEGAVEKAITSPTHVERSHTNSFVFVDSESTNQSGDPLRVPVKALKGGTSGRVRTVYFASSQSAQNVIWRRGDE